MKTLLMIVLALVPGFAYSGDDMLWRVNEGLKCTDTFTGKPCSEMFKIAKPTQATFSCGDSGSITISLETGNITLNKCEPDEASKRIWHGISAFHQKGASWLVTWDSVDIYCVGTKPSADKFGRSSNSVLAICEQIETNKQGHSQKFDSYLDAESFYREGSDGSTSSVGGYGTILKNFKLFNIEEIAP